MADPFTTALIIGGLTATTSAIQAERQNKATKRAAASQAESARIQTQQLRDSAAVERDKRIQEQRRISARLRVAAGESGLSLGSGTPLALQNQTQTDLNTNLGLLDQNLDSQILAVQSGAQANIHALEAQTINPLLATFTGGLSGASTGLSIGTAIKEART